jgi:hypothetical protein
MSTIGKSIATTISMTVLVLSLAVVSPTAAIGKGNKRTGNPARFRQGQSDRRRDNSLDNPASGGFRKRNVRPSGTGVTVSGDGVGFAPRASGTRSLLHGDFSSFGSNIRRSNPGFKTLSGMDSETEVIATLRPRNR